MDLITRLAVMLALVLPLCSQDVYDLLLKGGNVIDPKNGRNQRLDIAIASGKIQRIAPAIPAVQARAVVDVSDYIVTPGLIDIHAYIGTGGSGVVPDHNTLRFGVTTVVDAGSTPWKDFDQFKRQTIESADVRVLAFLGIKAGEAAAAGQVAAKNRETVVGFRASETDLRAAIEAAEASKTIVLAATAEGLRAGDIGTHLYRRDADLPAQQQARKKGILFDVGHGSDGFSFRTAVPAIKQSFLPDIISTGMNRESIVLPRTTMTSVMSRFLAMGLTVEQVIERTTRNPARAIRRPELGTLEEGGIADIAVFELRKGRFGFLDSGRERLTSDRELRCVLTIRGGKVMWDSEGLSLTDWKNAGPYSNFK